MFRLGRDDVAKKCNGSFDPRAAFSTRRSRDCPTRLSIAQWQRLVGDILRRTRSVQCKAFEPDTGGIFADSFEFGCGRRLVGSVACEGFTAVKKDPITERIGT